MSHVHQKMAPSTNTGKKCRKLKTERPFVAGVVTLKKVQLRAHSAHILPTQKDSWSHGLLVLCGSP